MYVVVQVGSHQYKAEKGTIITANRFKDDIGKTVDLEKVLLCADGDSIKVGQPHLTDVKVTAKVIEHALGDKVVAFKYRTRKDSSTKKGHRQKVTALEITKIDAK